MTLTRRTPAAWLLGTSVVASRSSPSRPASRSSLSKRRSETGLSAGRAEARTGPRWQPPASLTWYWQLQGPIANRVSAQAFDVDGFDTSAAEVARLHALGRRVICYIDVGTWENWRPDARHFRRWVLGRPNGWPGERWLDIRATDVLGPIMAARLGMRAQKGFDAVEPDNIDGCTNDTGFHITAAEQLRYNIWIAEAAYRLGLAVFEKNDLGQVRELEPYFDGALEEQCNQYDECFLLSPYLRAHKPVLDAEYDGKLYPSFCRADARAGIMGALFDITLNGKLYRPCWTLSSTRSRGPCDRSRLPGYGGSIPPGHAKVERSHGQSGDRSRRRGVSGRGARYLLRQPLPPFATRKS